MHVFLERYALGSEDCVVLSNIVRFSSKGSIPSLFHVAGAGDQVLFIGISAVRQ